jgi:hypothetical protein
VAFETAFLTLAGAVLLFVISDLLRGLVIGPILKLREHIGTIVDRVIFFAADLTSGSQVSKEREQYIREQLRSGSTQLRAREHMISGYEFWAKCGIVPKPSDLDTAARNLIGLSNSFAPNFKDTPEPGLPRTYFSDYKHNAELIQGLQEAFNLRVKIVPAPRKSDG